MSGPEGLAVAPGHAAESWIADHGRGQSPASIERLFELMDAEQMIAPLRKNSRPAGPRRPNLRPNQLDPLGA
jgi:hypothetical protein